MLPLVVLPLETPTNETLLEQEPKGLRKPKNRTNSTKEFSEQFEAVTGHYPVKQGVLRQIVPESSAERSAKSLSHSFFVVPFLSPIEGVAVEHGR